MPLRLRSPDFVALPAPPTSTNRERKSSPAPIRPRNETRWWLIPLVGFIVMSLILWLWLLPQPEPYLLLVSRKAPMRVDRELSEGITIVMPTYKRQEELAKSPVIQKIATQPNVVQVLVLWNAVGEEVTPALQRSFHEKVKFSPTTFLFQPIKFAGYR